MFVVLEVSVPKSSNQGPQYRYLINNSLYMSVMLSSPPILDTATQAHSKSDIIAAEPPR